MIDDKKIGLLFLFISVAMSFYVVAVLLLGVTDLFKLYKKLKEHVVIKSKLRIFLKSISLLPYFCIFYDLNDGWINYRKKHSELNIAMGFVFFRYDLTIIFYKEKIKE